MADMVILKGQNGGDLLVNLDNVLFIDTANTSNGPRLGFSTLVFVGAMLDPKTGQPMIPVQLGVRGTPEEIAHIIATQKRTIEIAQ